METGMGRETGGGEVHSRLSTHPHGGQETGGRSGMGESSTGDEATGMGGMMDQARDQAGEMMGQARDRAEDVMDTARGSMENVRGQAEEMAGIARNRVEGVMDQARSRMGDLPDRAGEMMGQARQRAGEMMDRAEGALEERTGVISRVRENPLPALGLAFAAGFLLAGGGETRGRRGRGVTSKAMNQLSGAVMGGISAAIAQELRGMAGRGGQGGGLGGMLQSFLGGQTGGDSDTSGRRDQSPQAQDSARAGM